MRIVKIWTGICIALLSYSSTAAWADILEVESAIEVSRNIEKSFQKGTVFLDVDDTLITPKSKLFRFSSPYRHLIDDIKKNRAQYKNFDSIIGSWRTSRKTILLDPAWPTIIQQLKTKYSVFALTQMDIGKAGMIESMEHWRYNELKAKNIFFSPLELDLEKLHQLAPKAGYLKGIFMTGSHSKSDVVSAYLQITQEKHIIVVDDRMDHLEAIQKLCAQKAIPYLGLHFTGLKKLDGEVDSEVAEYQKKKLLEEAQWLEDEEAAADLRKSK